MPFRRWIASSSAPARNGGSAGEIHVDVTQSRVFLLPLSSSSLPLLPVLAEETIYKLNHGEEALSSLINSLCTIRLGTFLLPDRQALYPVQVEYLFTRTRKDPVKTKA
jgi:hypothetical protein